MSLAYSIFRVKNEQEVLPEYLDLWFRRSEFDREAAFIAVGGVREVCHGKNLPNGSIHS